MTQQITRKAVEDMFTSVAEDTEWDLRHDMVWGYFFTDKIPEKLAEAEGALEKQGYKSEGIFEAEHEDGKAAGFCFLHLSRIETHTVDSLMKRNEELYAVAKEFNLDSYDGMDVGPVG